MPLAEAQQLFAMPDEAHEFVIYARDPRAGRGRWRPALSGCRSWRAPRCSTGRRSRPAMSDLVRLVEVVWIFVLLLVFVAAAAGVANTMLMATFERTHEFGMLLALGTAPSRIVGMILLESLALGATGALLGTALGGGAGGVGAPHRRRLRRADRRRAEPACRRSA